MKICVALWGQCIMAFHRQLLATIGRSVNEAGSSGYGCLVSPCRRILMQKSMPTGNLHCLLIFLEPPEGLRTLKPIHCIKQIITLDCCNVEFRAALNHTAIPVFNHVCNYLFSGIRA